MNELNLSPDYLFVAAEPKLIENQSQYTCELHGDIGSASIGWTERDGKEYGPWCMRCVADLLNASCRVAELVEEEDECSTS